MQTFFQTIAALQVQGGWKITIANEANNRMVVSILYFDNTVGDNASAKLIPMLLKGTPHEIDEGFFSAIEQPVKDTAQLFLNMEQYLKERELAKASSSMETDKEGKLKKEKEEQKKKYDGQIKKVDELEAAKNYQAAIACLPKAEHFPDYVEEIQKRLEKLRNMNGQLTLI